MGRLSEIIELALTDRSPGDLAEVLGVSPSHLSRVRRGKAGVGPEASLRLSEVAGRAPLDGLREDGHGELADVLEHLGAFRQRNMLDGLTPADRQLVLALIKSLAGKRGAKR